LRNKYSCACKRGVNKGVLFTYRRGIQEKVENGANRMRGETKKNRDK